MFWILLLIALIVGGAGLPVALRFVPPPKPRTLIRLRQGALHLAGENLRPGMRDSVAEILRPAKITRGFIAITSARRVIFSRNLPPELHQRLRNVLLNE